MMTKISMSADGSQMVAVAAYPGYIIIREPGTSTTITTMTNTTTASTRTAVTNVDESDTRPGGMSRKLSAETYNNSWATS